MIAWHFLRELHKVCHFQTNEGKRCGRASSSELQRWLKEKAVEVNREPIGWDEELPPFIYSFVMFPNNARKRCTLYHQVLSSTGTERLGPDPDRLTPTAYVDKLPL